MGCRPGRAYQFWSIHLSSRDVVLTWGNPPSSVGGGLCRAITLPLPSKRVIERLGSWATSASYSRRATLCRLRFRSAAESWLGVWGIVILPLGVWGWGLDPNSSAPWHPL